MLILLRTVPALIVLTALAACSQLGGRPSVDPPTVAVSPEDCPLPDGVSQPAPLAVTAQQVEAGSGSLKGFVLAAREVLIREIPAAEASHNACLLRKEGSSYRSGSTYLVNLTFDGRIWIHAKDMSLGGRLLKPQVYAAIFHALGIQQADLANPDTAQAAIFAAATGDGGPFDVPDLPGASGYVSMYLSGPQPYLLIGGMDLGTEHLVMDEVIDYGDPSITAAEVVDRATLKAFVTEAGNYFIELLETGGLAELSKARIAGRDPNGPWRHGSVYLYALDMSIDYIVFHGAFPDRYEMRPSVPTVRDAVTGKLILPQLLEIARSNPDEGGFLEYYFDDPTDDTDRADIPKTGYVRLFQARLSIDGTEFRTYEFIVGSGFYGSAP